jgi:predicted aldo/keto reductase-like oxidoreductase
VANGASVGRLCWNTKLEKGIALSAVGKEGTKEKQMSAKAGVPKREYRDGVMLSVVGFGGIIVMGHEQKEADEMVARAVEDGVNYFDVAPSYGKGEAQEKLGPALEPFRKNVFLACKTGKRDGERAQKELENSLKVLRTDHFDLYQLHGIENTTDAKEAVKKGGALDVLIKAKEQGKTKYIGFSAHSEKGALWLIDQYKFDSVMFPVNFVCWTQGNFGKALLKKAVDKEVTRLALKTLAYTKWPEGSAQKWPKCWYKPVDNQADVLKAVRWTLSKDITAGVSPSHVELFRMMVNAVREFTPMTQIEEKELLASTKGVEPIFRTGKGIE